jgi:hypothetical protein
LEQALLIVLPNSITSIGDYCFYESTSLTNIILPNSIRSIGRECFFQCSSIKKVDIPLSLTSIPLDCFSGCSSLQDHTHLYDPLALSERMLAVDLGNEMGIIQHLRINDPKSIVCSDDQVLTFDTSECIIQPMKSIQFSFQHPILLNGYLLRSGSDQYPRNWQIESSKDGKNWFLIDKHEDDETIQEPFISYKFQCFSFQTWLFIRIINMHWRDDYSLSFVDFFGKVFPKKSDE